MDNKKLVLTDVVVIRVFLILLLVFYHAFAIFSGAWTPLEGYPEIPAYWWLDKLSYAFMLEMFVFVSGYVFGFQVRTKGNVKLQTKSILWGKFKRLMIPCFIFSFLYILLLGDITQPLSKTIYGILSGIGHMWFLPMLFWCFVGIWIIEKIKLNFKLVLVLLFFCSVVSFLPLPLQMGSTMYYMLFFYIGYIIQKQPVSLDNYFNLKYCILSTLAFCLLFPILTIAKDGLSDIVIGGGNLLFARALRACLMRLLQLLYVFPGLIMCYLVVGYLEKKRKTAFPQFLIGLGNLCFGVYLIQQFILKGLYDHTNLPSILGCYWLPWIGFIIALLGSVIISKLLLKTKIGKILIG